jgi:hypothetical protein
MRSLVTACLIAATISLETNASAEPAPPYLTYEIAWGGVSNIEAGAMTASSLSSIVFDQVSLVIEGSRVDHWAMRTANFLVLQLYLGGLGYGTFAHEFFGHFGHAIQDGLHPSLHLNFPSFGGTTQFTITYRTPALTRQVNASSGPEVTETEAYEATQAMYSGHPVGSYIGLELVGGHLIDSFIYWLDDLQPFVHDPVGYFANVKSQHPLGPVLNDPTAWALALTERYGGYQKVIPPGATWVYVPANPKLYVNDFVRDQSNRVKLAYILQLCDPTMLNGLYGIGRYLVTGEPFYRPIMLGVPKFRVAPAIRANLGYLGAENYFDLFATGSDIPPFSVYFRTGGNMVHKQHGGGGEVREIHIGNRVDLGGALDVWYDELNRKVGGSLEPKVTVRFSPQVGVSAALGYKSLGGLMGKPTEAGFYGYEALSVTLPEPKPRRRGLP